MKIKCSVHGAFSQRPKHHKLGRGCPKCVHRGKFKTLNELVQAAKNIHGDRYDYSGTTFVPDLRFPITIKCKSHGEFNKKAYLHLRGAGCPSCSFIHKSASSVSERRAKVLRKAHIIHGDRYDYSRMEYHHTTVAVEIICKKHGSFWQKMRDHLITGAGCQICGSEARTTSAADFLSRANKIFDNKYTYEVREFYKMNDKIVITCPEHGPFNQLVTNHLTRHGCVKCSGQVVSSKLRKTYDQFLTKAREVHGDRYQYFHYSKNSEKIPIRCSMHGIFHQKPSNHVDMGQGCPKCAVYGCYTQHYFDTNPDKKNRPAKLYLCEINYPGGQLHKVGITARSFKKRYAYTYGFTVKLLKEWSGSLFECWKQEQILLGAVEKQAPPMLIGGDKECFPTDQLHLIDELMTGSVLHSCQNSS